MKPLDELIEYLHVVAPLMRPNHKFTSLMQLFRATRAQDDKARRVLGRMSEAYGVDSLLELKGRRFTLTEIGKEVYLAAEHLVAIGMPKPDAMNEVVTVEVAPEIDPLFLAQPLTRFFEEWAGLVAVKIHPLDAEGVRTNISSGLTSFGVGLAEADGSSGCALLPSPAVWTAVVPHDHPLGAEKSVTAGQLATYRVFVPAMFAERLSPHLAAVGTTNQVVVPTAEAVRVSAVCNLGVGLDLDFGATGLSVSPVRVPVLDLPPVPFGLYLPRKPECLSEAALYLLDLLKAQGRRDSAPRPTSASDTATQPESEPLSV